MSYMRSAARHRQILDCAKRVFAERGFHAANVSHLCEAAGIGRGTLYLYFANKRAVLTAILRETLDKVRALMERQSRETTYPPPEKVRRSQAIEFSAMQLRQILAVVFEDEHIVHILLREAVGLDVDVEALLDEIDDVLIALVERELRVGQRAGFIRELDAHMTATMIVGGVEKLALAALRSEAPIDLDALCREAARLHGVGTISERLRPD
jgi:TetR/AcrR family fatty acid metabolism transcriptional regulator